MNCLIRKLVFALWAVIFGIAHTSATILPPENRVWKISDVGYDAIGRLNVDYDSVLKASSARALSYDERQKRNANTKGRRLADQRASIGASVRLLAAKNVETLALPTIRQAEGGLVIGRGADLSRPFALAENEFKLSWPATATTRSEWKINSGLLRQEMGKGVPIRDASPGNVGGMYLNAERNLLESRGGNYNSATGYWHPPGT